ncbi:MAG: hypothetical protein R2849_07625 [Thermomicrobiales bacterium]
MLAQGFFRHHHLSEMITPLLLALPILGVFWFDALGALTLFVVAFAVGLLLHPRHLWTVWLEAVVLWWLAGAAWTLWGEDAGPGEAEETVISFMIETFIFTAILVLFPLYLGRAAHGGLTAN